MKKLISLALVLVMALSVLAGCSNEPANNGGENGTVTGPASALEVLENIWTAYGDEKFPVMGGNPEGGVMDAPAVWDQAYAEGLYSYLQLTAEDGAAIDEAATLIHMMNANTFTGAVYHLAEGTDVAAFAQTQRDAIQNAQWMCGFPERLVIADMGGQYLLVSYGVADAMEPFVGHLAQAYPDVTALFDEAIGG